LLIENIKLMQVVAEQRSAAKAFCQKLHVTLIGLAFGGGFYVRPAQNQSGLELIKLNLRT